MLILKLDSNNIQNMQETLYFKRRCKTSIIGLGKVSLIIFYFCLLKLGFEEPDSYYECLGRTRKSFYYIDYIDLYMRRS